MPTALAPSSEPVKATERERPAVEKLEAALNAPAGKLAGPDGGMVPIPAPVYALLRRIVAELTRGHAVTVVPVHAELSTQQAADLLNVSRPYVVKLLDQKKIAFRKVGTHRRIRFDDLMQYRRERSATRRDALIEMAREAHDQGISD